MNTTVDIHKIRTELLAASPSERAGLREMAEDALATESLLPQFRPYHEAVLQALNELANEGGSEDKDLTLGQTVKKVNRRQAGQGAGRGVVKIATDKQQHYVRHLLETRDITKVSRFMQAEVSRAAADVAINKLSKRLCSDVLDTLTALPPIAGLEKMDARLTERQEQLIIKLAMEKAGALELLAEYKITSLETLSMMPKEDAIQVIDRLFKLPAKDRVDTQGRRVELTEGIYYFDGEIYGIVRAKGGAQRLYAKKLVVDSFGKASFRFAGGMMRKLLPEHKITREQAKEFGSLYGVCCRCGRVLSNDDSIDRMMGPVCYSKMGW